MQILAAQFVLEINLLSQFTKGIANTISTENRRHRVVKDWFELSFNHMVSINKQRSKMSNQISNTKVLFLKTQKTKKKKGQVDCSKWEEERLESKNCPATG